MHFGYFFSFLFLCYKCSL